MSARPVTLAVITGAHGVGGAVRLKLFCENVDSLRAHQHFNDAALTLTSVRETPQGALASFAEIKDRSAAEAMRCVPLTVSRDSLPPLAEGEYYHADLIGLSVRTPDGARVGTCVSVENFGAGDILEIEKADGKSFMMPLRPDAIPAWDAAVITINPDYIV